MEASIKQHLALGRELYAAGEHVDAELHLRKVIETHDGFADVHNMLGFIYFNRGQHEHALKHFERAVDLNPRYTDAALNLAVLYNELGRYDDAQRVTTLAGSGNESARRRMATAEAGAAGQAAPASMPPAAVALDSLDAYVRGKLANLHQELGQAYVAVGLLPRAIVEFEKALELSPTFVDVRTRLGAALMEDGQLEQALDELRAVAETSPQYVPGQVQLGLVLWKLGDVAKAREHWLAAQAIDPDNRSCRLYLSMTKDQP